MKAQHLRMGARPCECQQCGEDMRGRRSELVWFAKRWLCGECLNGGVEPIYLDRVVYARREVTPIDLDTVFSDMTGLRRVVRLCR